MSGSGSLAGNAGRSDDDRLRLPIVDLAFTLQPVEQCRTRPLALLEQRGAVAGQHARRVLAQAAAGLIDELRALREKYALDANLPSMRCVGYRQVWDFLDGNCDATTLRDKGIFATRQLAKRQLTWMRSMPDLEIFDCCDFTTASSIISRVVEWHSRSSER